MYMYIRVLSDLNQRRIPSFRGSCLQSYTLPLYLFCTLFIYLFIYVFISYYFYIMDLSIFIYLFIYLLLCIFLLLLTYCYHPVLIITCILNQIVYISHLGEGS